MEKVFERLDGFRDKEPIELIVVGVESFAMSMVMEAQTMKYMFKCMTDDCIAYVKGKKGITFDPNKKEELVELFWKTMKKLENV